MKINMILISLFFLPLFIDAQTAEEVLLKSQAAYRALDNYVDEGVQARTITPQAGIHLAPEISGYFLAFDRKRNIHFWIHDENDATKGGTSYLKTEDDSLGVFKRLDTEDPAIQDPPNFAAARASGRGGSMFGEFGSLFYPDFNGDQNDSSRILRYDWANRLTDTVINGQTCFVIKTGKTVIVSKEQADKQNFLVDSMNGLLTLPMEQRGGPRAIPGPKYSEVKYYIRKSDLLIVRQVQLRYKEGSKEYSSITVLTLNPKTNVKDFKSYIAGT